MYCFDCHHRCIPSVEKAITGENREALVYKSQLTDSWVCDETGNEHRIGNATDYAGHVQSCVETVQAMVENGDLTGAQAFEVLLIDLGFKERTEGAKKIGYILDGIQRGLLTEDALIAAIEAP